MRLAFIKPCTVANQFIKHLLTIKIPTSRKVTSGDYCFALCVPTSNMLTETLNSFRMNILEKMPTIQSESQGDKSLSIHFYIVGNKCLMPEIKYLVLKYVMNSGAIVLLASSAAPISHKAFPSCSSNCIICTLPGLGSVNSC